MNYDFSNEIERAIQEGIESGYGFDYGYGSSWFDRLLAPAAFMFTGVWLVISLCVIALSVVALWFLFKKAGEPGWAAVVPFYNAYTLFKITWGSGWLFLLMLIPIANIVIYIITMVKLSKAFGQGGGWACGLIFLHTIFLCITAFSQKYQYVGVPDKPGYNAGGTNGAAPNQGYQYNPQTGAHNAQGGSTAGFYAPDAAQQPYQQSPAQQTPPASEAPAPAAPPVAETPAPEAPPPGADAPPDGQ